MTRRKCRKGVLIKIYLDILIHSLLNCSFAFLIFWKDNFLCASGFPILLCSFSFINQLLDRRKFTKHAFSNELSNVHSQFCQNYPADLNYQVLNRRIFVCSNFYRFTTMGFSCWISKKIGLKRLKVAFIPIFLGIPAHVSPAILVPSMCHW